MIKIDDLIGLPYSNNGRGPDFYDCIGLAIEVEKRFGYTIPDLAAFLSEDAIEHFENFTDEIVRTDKKLKLISAPNKASDILLFLNSRGVLHHIGVYLGNNQFIHCNKYGVHLDRLSRFPEKVGRVYTWQ